MGKIGFLIESGEVRPEEILALAYGRDAAKEMRARVADRIILRRGFPVGPAFHPPWCARVMLVFLLRTVVGSGFGAPLVRRTAYRRCSV